MKIVTWNCCGKFREDLPYILDKKSDFYIDADIYVIQECENPDENLPKYKKYKELVEKTFGCNYKWVGDIHYKGLGIFAKRGIDLKEIELNGNFKHFLAFRVEDSFNLLGVWAMGKDEENKDLNPYVEMIHDYFDANVELFDENLIMCGDFNSNKKFNYHHPKDKNHCALEEKLNGKHLKSVYHELSNESNGEETHATFFQARHLNQPYYMDYVYSNKEIIKNTTFTKNGKKVKKDLPNGFEILDHGRWISLSDHLPIVFEIGEK